MKFATNTAIIIIVTILTIFGSIAIARIVIDSTIEPITNSITTEEYKNEIEIVHRVIF